MPLSHRTTHEGSVTNIEVDSSDRMSSRLAEDRPLVCHHYNELPQLLKAPQGLEPLDDPRPSLQIKDLQRIRVTGRGPYGKYYIARKKAGCQLNAAQHLFAVKSLNKRRIRRLDQHTPSYKEVERMTLSRLPWSHWVNTLIDTCHDSQNLYLVLEYMPHGSLCDLISNGPVDATRASFYFSNLVCALLFLETHNVVHCYLRPENILISFDNYLCLTNFDHSASTGDDIDYEKWRRMDTLAYLAPELFFPAHQTATYSSTIDWWACGCILFELLTQSSAFNSQGPSETVPNPRQSMYTWPSGTSMGKNARYLVSALLAVSPIDRLGSGGAEQVREHLWLQNIDWPRLENHQYTAPALPSSLIRPQT
jgi:serine/threonine protein kinase